MITRLVRIVEIWSSRVRSLIDSLMWIHSVIDVTVAAVLRCIPVDTMTNHTVSDSRVCVHTSAIDVFAHRHK